VVREDPTRRGLLYAGTERGVWVSFDDGASWQSLRLNLPIVPVHDLAVKEGTSSRRRTDAPFGFWTTFPATAVGARDPAESVHLFKRATRPAWIGGRLRRGGSDAHPVGKNPPNGAMIYYSLKNKNQEVKLDILDAAGRLIRSFSSRQDSLTVVDSTRADSVKHQRTDSLKQAGITDSVKIDSILAADTLKDEDKPWPRRPPAPHASPTKRA